MLQPLQSSSISPGAVLGSLAMTPDNAKLLASDPADASVVVFDLAGNTSSAVKVFSPSESAIAVRATMPVAALKGNKAFVLITPWIQDELREIDLTNMTVKIRGDLLPSEFSDVPSTLTSSADGSVALLGGATGGYSPPFFAWRYDTSSDSFSPAMGLLSAEGYGGAVNADGSVLVMGALSLDQALLPLVPLQLWDYRQRLTASGALRYTPSAVSDTRTGHLLLSFETGNSPTALAIDPHGKKVLSCSGTTLYYHEFSVVPLAVATVTPAQAAVGARLTLRGNGFVSGTSVTLGGQRASCSRVDDQTLQCSVPNLKPGLAPMTLSNPDGQSYQFEAAVTVE